MRFSNPSPGSVATLVDSPRTTNLALAGAGSFTTLDITSALSLDISAVWKIGTAKIGNGFRYFATLRIDWLDADGVYIFSDAVDMVHHGSGTVGALSYVASVRCPAVGATAQFSMQPTTASQPLANNDSMTVSVTLTQRPTDRFRVFGYTGIGPTFPPNTNQLMSFACAGMNPGAVSFLYYSVPFDGPVDLHLQAVQAGSFNIFYGGQANIVDAFPNSNGTANFAGMREVIAIGAGGFVNRTFYCPRSSVGVQWTNGATAGGAAFALVLAGEI